MTNAIKYTCEGPRQSVQQVREDLGKRIAVLQDKHDATSKAVRGPILAKLAELRGESKALAKRADDELLGRKGCGFDLTALIEAIPDDGEVYEYTCLKCGNTGTVRKTVPEAVA
jgi:hypothetical protein